jgi:hypothetical protein
MIAKLVDTLFGCWHNRYSFPMTIRANARKPSRSPAAAALTGMYVVCLDCGRELPYDWQQMRVIGSPSQARHYAQELATREAA